LPGPGLRLENIWLSNPPAEETAGFLFELNWRTCESEPDTVELNIIFLSFLGLEDGLL
jgi:hypothetical protein